VLVVFAIGAALILVLGWRPRANPSPQMWDIPTISGAYTGVVGMLAGFTVSGAIFIASLGPGKESNEFAAVVGTLFICFLILVAAAMMYASTPTYPRTANETGVMVQALTNVCAGGVYFLGLSVSWFALHPLLKMIGLPEVAESFIWLLLVVAIYESARLGLIAYRLTLAGITACLAIPLIGAGLAAAYWFVASHGATFLWPQEQTVLRFGYMTFAVAAVGFTLQTGLLLVHGNDDVERWANRYGHLFGIVYLQIVSIAVLLAWFGIATR
jgi:hypothetical protein